MVEMGVDEITSNRIATLIDVLAEMGVR
jgi:hypothetical protein